MFDEMLRLSRLLVDQNSAFMTLQVKPLAAAEDIAQFLLLMQFCFVTSHEYSHLVPQHLTDESPHAAALGEALCQAPHYFLRLFHRSGLRYIASR